MSLAQFSVFSSLLASPKAKVSASMSLGFGQSAAIWQNADDRVSYLRPDGHTFSLYLQGGTGTSRVDGGVKSGWPGALCVMPQGASSEWEITESFQFVHLYVQDQELRRAFTETFDQDCRQMVMPEVTFDNAPALEHALRRLAMAVQNGDSLAAEEATTTALTHLFVHPRYGGKANITIKGGLSPILRHRLIDYIETHLHLPITLQTLADIADLSPFHLQRMFQLSCGLSPHEWLLRRRLSKAKTLLATQDPIAQIASACGFSSQSHMTRAFKEVTGCTPSVYRGRAKG
ncbi:AraC family transcriptional regulator [Agrobacterium vitis]|nr:AraC family transcriptional regulator [Agrobacterium vitis]MBE1439367.1 AraC family transcriptional regulator [Agrobacterium vitis]